MRPRRSAFPHPLKVLILAKAKLLFHPVHFLLAKVFGARRANGQTLAPFQSSRLQHSAPAFGLHFFTKAVQAQTMQAFRLPRSFQFVFLPKI